LKKIKKNPDSGEYYLTDLIDISKGKFYAFLISSSEWVGVNTQEELKLARRKI